MDDEAEVEVGLEGLAQGDGKVESGLGLLGEVVGNEDDMDGMHDVLLDRPAPRDERRAAGTEGARRVEAPGERLAERVPLSR